MVSVSKSETPVLSKDFSCGQISVFLPLFLFSSEAEGVAGLIVLIVNPTIQDLYPGPPFLHLFLIPPNTQEHSYPNTSALGCLSSTQNSALCFQVSGIVLFVFGPYPVMLRGYS